MRLAKDLKAFSKDGGIKKIIITVLTNPCFHSVCLFRLSNLLYRFHLTFLAKLIWYINRLLYHVDIDYRADLAGGFVLVHGLGTVIGSGVKSEGFLKVYQGVTIGGSRGNSAIYKGGRIWQPLIKGNVVVYTGAGIFDPVVIGENNIIKAGAIISKNLADVKVGEKQNESIDC